MDILKIFKEELESVFDKLGYDKDSIVVSFSDRPDIADLQCNSAFVLAKKLHISPILIATNISNELTKQTNKFIFSVVGGFVNAILSTEFLKSSAKEIYNLGDLGVVSHKGETVVLDYGGANVAKPLHVGHLRSAVIGQALCNLAKFCGYNTIADVHLGDWGLQMGLTVAYIMENYDTKDYFDGGARKNIITPDILEVAYPTASAKSKVDVDFLQKARNITAKLQKKENGYYQIYEDIRSVSIEMVKKGYHNLGVNFDLWWGESTAQPYTAIALDKFSSKNLLRESEGAQIVEVAKESDTAPMPPMIAKASSGADLYAITDVATVIMREEKFSPNEIWYITDARQALHFEQVFRAIRLAQIVPDKTKLLHFGFGTMNGTDGKPFKTRDGGVMKLDELVALLTSEAQNKLAQNGTPDENGLSKIIGVSALKFGDMINYRLKDIVFDVDRFSSFEGKTGPYVLYSIVRIKSILRKSGEYNFSLEGELSNIEKAILTRIVKVPNDINMALNEKAPNYIAQALYEISSLFSTFYNSTKILSEQNYVIRDRYLSVCEITKTIMEKLCSILGITVPEKM